MNNTPNLTLTCIILFCQFVLACLAFAIFQSDSLNLFRHKFAASMHLASWHKAVSGCSLSILLARCPHKIRSTIIAFITIKVVDNIFSLGVGNKTFSYKAMDEERFLCSFFSQVNEMISLWNWVIFQNPPNPCANRSGRSSNSTKIACFVKAFIAFYGKPLFIHFYSPYEDGWRYSIIY